MDAWGSLFALLASQHQVVAIRQVAELGIDPRTFLRHANRQEWIGHGGTLWSPPGTTLDTWGLAMAAALRAGDHATVTGLAGLHLHGLDVPFPTPVSVVTPMSRHAVRTADPDRVRIIASRTLRDDDMTVRRRLTSEASIRARLGRARGIARARSAAPGPRRPDDRGGLRFHSSQQQLAIDQRKDRRYRQAGWTVFRIGWWEFDHGWRSFASDLRAALTASS